MAWTYTQGWTRKTNDSSAQMSYTVYCSADHQGSCSSEYAFYWLGIFAPLYRLLYIQMSPSGQFFGEIGPKEAEVWWKRNEVQVEELKNTDARYRAVYKGLVSYKYISYQSSGGPPSTGPTSYSFSTRGERTHVLQSKQTVNSYVASGTAPSFQGAINVDGQKVGGTDIIIPVFNFGMNKEFTIDEVDDAFKASIYLLTGKTNAGVFDGKAANEVLFLGATGRQRGDEAWSIDFQFAASPNITSLSLGGITGIAKKGFEYLWVLYETDEDVTAKFLIKKPLAVYVERVYDEGDFTGLQVS